MENLILLLIALVAGLLIYLVLNSLIKVLPRSGFRSFMLSGYGKIVSGFITLVLLYAGFVYMMIHSGIQC